MSVYVDGLAIWTGKYSGDDAGQAERVGARNGHKWCHLIADEADCEELHVFAAALGCKRAWFQRDHYDLTPARRAKAVAAGAIEVNRRQLVQIRRRQRGA